MEEKPELIRGGFSVPKGRSMSNETTNKIADAAMKLRILKRSSKPLISTTLIRTRIPQAFSNYINNGRCCTLGVICKKAEAIPSYWFKKGKKFNGEPRWHKLTEYFNVTDEELNRVVWCPVCSECNCLLYAMAHLNDIHKWNNNRIGKWLKQFRI